MNGKAPQPAVSLGERLLCFLFPARCLLCGQVVPAGKTFCGSCEGEVPETPCRRRYSLPGAGAEGFRIISPAPYEGGFRKALYRFKFQGQRALAKPLGRLMAQAAAGEKFDGVTWTPMTAKKKRKRGYDQSQLLAKETAKALQLPCIPLLEKVRENGVQHQLSRRERAKNVKNAYRAKEQAAGLSLLLVDDIVTTGATMKECAGALYAAGAKKVTGLCAADAPETQWERGSSL